VENSPEAIKNLTFPHIAERAAYTQWAARFLFYRVSSNKKVGNVQKVGAGPGSPFRSGSRFRGTGRSLSDRSANPSPHSPATRPAKAKPRAVGVGISSSRPVFPTSRGLRFCFWTGFKEGRAGPLKGSVRGTDTPPPPSEPIEGGGGVSFLLFQKKNIVFLGPQEKGKPPCPPSGGSEGGQGGWPAYPEPSAARPAHPTGPPEKDKGNRRDASKGPKLYRRRRSRHGGWPRRGGRR